MPAKIASIETGCYRIPLPVVVSDATHGDMAAFQLITVQLKDDDGQSGLGYTFTVGSGGRGVQALIDHDLAPFLQGLSSADILPLWDSMWQRLHWVGRGGAVAFAMAAVDIALWDLQARRCGLPLWQFLRSQANDLFGVETASGTPAVRAYAGGIDLQFPLEQLLEQTQANLDRGFRAIKMKVGRDRLDEDVERVAAMREFLGDSFPLMLDANMRWSVDEAVTAARAFRDFGPVWLEEPIDPDDFVGHQIVAKQGGLPVAAGENLHSVAEFRRLIDDGEVAWPEPDLAVLGGVTAWMRVAKLAQDAGLPVTTHGVHDLHVHLLAAVSNASYLEAHGFGLDRFMAEPLRIEDGLAVVPNRSGHGIQIDWDVLETHREV